MPKNFPFFALALSMMPLAACGGVTEMRDDNTGASGSGGEAQCPSTRPVGACSSEGKSCEYPSGCAVPPSIPCVCSSGQWKCNLADCTDASLPPPSKCPADPPLGACSEPGLECTYGDDPRFWCRELATCTNGAWSVLMPKCVGTGPNCPADSHAPPPNLCQGSGTVYCVYELGVACDCELGDLQPDGGPEYQWTCMQPPGEDCPDLAPNAGQGCTLAAGKQCSYGFPCMAVIMECAEQFWKATPGPPC